MNRHIHLVIILVDDANHLLIAIARWNTNQSTKLSDSKINMHNKVARLHLLQFLHRQRHLTGTSCIGSQIILMETVEYLMVCKETTFFVLINESLVNGLLHRHESNLITTQLLTIKDIFETLLLLLAIS